MVEGLVAGITWALETIFLSLALQSAPFVKTDQAIFLAPFVSTFLHDTCSALYMLFFNLVRGKGKKVVKALTTFNGRLVMIAALIGGPIGMTGYTLAVNNMGSAIGAVSTAIFPAIGSVLACYFLKEKMQWYRWIFLIATLLGIYGLSYSPNVDIKNWGLGILGVIMCSVGWGVEAVILAKSMQSDLVSDNVALQIRQSASAIFYGIVLLPILGGWKLTGSLFVNHEFHCLGLIALAGLFATISYLFYYIAINKIGAAKAMALDISYVAWAFLITVVVFNKYNLLNTLTILCTLDVFICGILAATDFSSLKGK